MARAKALHSTLEDRFQAAGEGMFLLLIGALLIPGGTVEYAAVAAVGALLLGLNAARVAAGHRPRWFSVTVGAWATIGGLGALAGLHVNGVSLFFLLLGVVVLGAAALQGADGKLLPGRRHPAG